MLEVVPQPEFEREVEKALARRRLDLYQPYPKQREFHATGADPLHVERALVAGNQVGKTWCAASETAMHLTGQYPSWWVGRRFTKPVTCWVGGPSSQTTRDAPQLQLLGPVGEWGSGTIPGRLFVGDPKKSLHGVADAVEIVSVLHEPTGGTSRLMFKSYDQGRIRWQGATVDFIWGDEEPPDDIYSEACTRVQVKGGFVMLTLTPLLGMTEVITRLLKKKPPGSIVVKMGINDALHYTPEQRAAIVARYPEHERQARAEGDPIMGSGRVFPIDEQAIMETPIQIPAHWPRIAGLDIGWEHATAVVWVAWDRDTDTIHVYDAYKMTQQTPVVHAATMKMKGAWIPVAWPHDGLRHDPGSGKIIAQLYLKQGVRMLPQHATHPPERGKKEGTGGFGLEAGILDMIDRMQTGRFKVSSVLQDWWDEYRMYYRKEGLIVKEDDDLMSATRIACMSIRHATTQLVRNSAPVLPGSRQSTLGMGVLG